MPTQTHQKLSKTKKTITIALVIASVSVMGLLTVTFFNNRAQNAEVSFASNNLPELTQETTVTAVNTSGNNELVGLNVRADTCSTEIVGVVDFGQTGTLLDPEGKIDTCVGRTLTWYNIEWDDGTTGWSITDFLDFEDAAVD